MAAISRTTFLNAIFLKEKDEILTKISLKFVPKGTMYNNIALIQIMAWCRKGNKPLSEPMLTWLSDAYLLILWEIIDYWIFSVFNFLIIFFYWMQKCFDISVNIMWTGNQFLPVQAIYCTAVVDQTGGVWLRSNRLSYKEEKSLQFSSWHCCDMFHMMSKDWEYSSVETLLVECHR